jgi:hypothetical protein
MDLKPKLEDYTEPEFLHFVKKIWAVDVPEDEHGRLVMHFDKVSQHPDGADLLFYSGDYGNYSSPEGAVISLKLFRAHKGLPGFKPEPSNNKPAGHGGSGVPASKPLTPINSGVIQRKAQRSAHAAQRAAWFADQRKLAAELDLSEEAADDALTHLDVLLRKLEAESLAVYPTGTEATRLTQLEENVLSLELAGQKAWSEISRIKGIQMRTEFARSRAESNAKYPSINRSAQDPATALRNITQISQQHLGRWPAVEHYNTQLQARATAFLESAEERLTRLETAAGKHPLKTASVFIAPATSAAAGPLVMTPAAEAMAAFDIILPELQEAILSAVAQFTRVAAAGAGKYANVLLFSTKLGNGERYALSVPLSELTPVEGRDWQGLARAGGEVALPFRLGAGVVEESSIEMAQLYITPTDGKTLPAHVRVRAAAWDPHKNAYSFTPADSAPITLVWTPAALSTEPFDSVNYPGIMSTPSFPEIETFSANTDVHFDDYIIVFPGNSRLAPLYVTFKNRLDYPGVVSGLGQPFSGSWPEAAKGSGAPVPTRIANQLRERVFKRFAAFKEAFWKSIAADSELSAQFNTANQELMKKGFAPSSEPGQKLAIHHKHAVSEGGEVYDVDNLTIMTIQEN